MPHKLVAIGPNQPAYREYAEPALEPNQVRVRSEFSAAKMGTESRIYRGASALVRGRMNENNIYVSDATSSPFPFSLGNMTVGRIIESGRQVARFKVGDRVCLFGDWRTAYGFSETHVAPDNEALAMPETITPESATCLDPGVFALAGIRDGGVGLGDRIAIFGLGAIGQMAVQTAKLSGAREVFGVDLFDLRRKAAERYGATRTIHPVGCDVGHVIKEATGGMGVDVAIEFSGAAAALHEAIRATAKGGKIVTVGCYEGGATELRLGEDWARNQQVLIASRGSSSPSHGHPSWAGRRLNDTVWELLVRGELKTEGLVTPIVRFDEAAEAYERADKNPATVIKFGVRY